MMIRSATALALLLGASASRAQEDGFVPLFNGRDLEGWVSVACAPETWSVRDGVIHCTGKPTGALRTARQYENFILEAEWRHLSSGGNSGIFIWGTAISAPGVPFLRGIEVQVLDNGFNVKGKNEWYTTHGDVFPIHGAKMKPIGRSNGQRGFPSEERSKSSPEWNHYRIVADRGSIRLHVNGKEVSGGDDCNYRKGYLALESEGAPVEFRNVRLKELPGADPAPELVAPVEEGWTSLYTGTDLRGWRNADAAASRWRAADWVLQQKTGGEPRTDLATEREFGDADLIVDAKVKPGTSGAGLLLRPGVLVPFTHGEPGKWARYRLEIRGRQASLAVNGKVLAAIEIPEDAPARAPLAIVDAGGGVDLANLFVRVP
jgi:hypothetical protein